MKDYKKVLAVGMLTASVALFAQQATAATDGTLGATSTGTSLISLIVGQVYQISSLTDFAFGTYLGSGNLTANNDVCVYTNDATTNYHVLITDSSSMSSSGFSVQNAGATADIPYTVKWNTATGTTGNQAITYNTALAGANANTVSTTCATGGKSANLQVNLASADLQAAPAGAYSTTLTVLVEP